jgi:hypothetical protein
VRQAIRAAKIEQQRAAGGGARGVTLSQVARHAWPSDELLDNAAVGSSGSVGGSVGGSAKLPTHHGKPKQAASIDDTHAQLQRLLGDKLDSVLA